MFNLKKKSQPQQPICKNCSLFDAEDNLCRVIMPYQGEKLQLSTNPNDMCHWDQMGVPVKQIRVWSDGKDGFIES